MRNKHPEITVEKILVASKKLFIEKGYDQTTIQDIVKELGGLTKGAVYHHFKSKEDILTALLKEMFAASNPFAIVKARNDLNGLQKIQEAMMLNRANEEKSDLSNQTVPLLDNPRILAGLIKSNQEMLTPQILELIEEGKADGSINTQYAKELAELFSLLELWMIPSLYPMTEIDMKRKICFMKDLFEAMELPLFNDEIVKMIDLWFQEVSD